MHVKSEQLVLADIRLSYQIYVNHILALANQPIFTFYSFQPLNLYIYWHWVSSIYISDAAEQDNTFGI